jgi:protease-4
MNEPLLAPAPEAPPSALRRLAGLTWWTLLPLAAGLLLAFYLIPRPAVGVIRLSGDIWGNSAEILQMQIDEARKDPRIRAVVVRIDSPGGEVVATQSIYLELLALRKEVPVVASIESIAASGGFYAAMAADPIYARPSSVIGNVGVWGYFPADLAVNDVVLASGPFKLTANNSESFLSEIEAIKQEFMATVTAGRGARLKLSSAELTQGLAYPGRQAQQSGLVDFLGGQSDAVAKAAELAGIAHYEVVDLQLRALLAYDEAWQPILNQPWAGAADPATGRRSLPPGIYLLYNVLPQDQQP